MSLRVTTWVVMGLSPLGSFLLVGFPNPLAPGFMSVWEPECFLHLSFALHWAVTSDLLFTAFLLLHFGHQIALNWTDKWFFTFEMSSANLNPVQVPNPTTITPDSICFRALLDHHGPRSRFEKQNSAKAVSCSLSSFPLQVTIIKDHHYRPCHWLPS